MKRISLALWLIAGLAVLGLACNLPTQVTQAPQATQIPTITPTLPVLPPATAASLPTECPPPDGWEKYIVGPDEDLLRIATLTGSSVEELVIANCLGETMTATAGQMIYVPNPPFTEYTTPTGLAMFYLIIPEDAGQSGPPVGCGDSSIAVQSERPTYDIPFEDIRASLEALFAIKTADYGQSGLAHSLYEADLRVQHISVSGDIAVVNLLGTLPLIGTCADARMEAQILLTVFQYEGFSQALITLNGENLKQYFDLSGLVQPGDFYQRSDIIFE